MTKIFINRILEPIFMANWKILLSIQLYKNCLIVNVHITLFKINIFSEFCEIKFSYISKVVDAMSSPHSKLLLLLMLLFLWRCYFFFWIYDWHLIFCRISHCMNYRTIDGVSFMKMLPFSLLIVIQNWSISLLGCWKTSRLKSSEWRTHKILA